MSDDPRIRCHPLQRQDNAATADPLRKAETAAVPAPRIVGSIGPPRRLREHRRRCQPCGQQQRRRDQPEAKSLCLSLDPGHLVTVAHMHELVGRGRRKVHPPAQGHLATITPVLES